ncbi:MAG: fabG2 [Solirubrobacterales bacterium]|nr:fabG2 [Solirubrobacterales bacterium]
MHEHGGTEHEAHVSAVTPLGRIGEPADVASAVAFLAGDASAWVTGETLVNDGGQIHCAPVRTAGPAAPAA